MSAQLNRFMALLVLCGLLLRPAMAASADSLSTQTGIMRTGKTEKVGPAQAALAVSDSTDRKKRKRTVDRLALFGISVIGGTLIGAELGPVLLKEPEDCPDDSFLECDLRALEGGLLGFLAGGCIGIILASDLAMATSWSERSRKPPESRRVSVDLLPNPKGSLSAVATLHF